MNYKNKYLKYKTKYITLSYKWLYKKPLNTLLNGGGKYDLTGQERTDYLWRCNQLYCSKNANYDGLIKMNLDKLFEIVKKVIDDIVDEKIKTYMQEKLKTIIETEKEFTITTLNIKSL